ncbi:MAG: SSS family solute:Na+ symporter [Alteromonas naphthalenivorans]
MVLGYTMIGGLAAVVIADFVQIIIIITVFSGICLYSLFTNPISFFTVENYSQAKLILTQSSLSWGQAFKILTMPIFFSIIEQDLAQRFFAAKTERTAALSAFFASILLLLFSFVPFYLGMQARLSGALIPSGVNPLLPILKTLTSPFVFVLALCALLSAITSTTDSLLCAVSAIITTMITRFNKSIKPSVSISRGVTLICGLLTLGASYLVPPNIIDILIGSYELSVSCLFVPLFFCFITKDLRREAALSSALFGAIGFLFFLTSNYISLQAYSVVITLGFSLLGYALGFALSSKKK